MRAKTQVKKEKIIALEKKKQACPEFQSLLEKIKKESKPLPEEGKEVNGFVKAINKLLEKKKIKARCIKGGSFAKGTFLRGDFDVDLFVRFSTGYKNTEISALLGNALKPLKPVLVHGSRDYYQIENEHLFEIVPVLAIKKPEQAVNVTDASPLHVDYTKSHIRKNPLLPDEIRLAKLFCKAIKVYGAESYIQGFSGHVIDILVIYYGSFLNLVKAASAWKGKVVIDPEAYWDDPVFELNKSKTISPLVIVDPIQKERNAAAAVSQKKYNDFIMACRKFLKSPSESFFRSSRLSRDSISYDSRNNRLFFIETEPLQGKKDVVGAKIMKVYFHILSKLRGYGFDIIGSDYEFKDKGRMYFITAKKELSNSVVIQGPFLEGRKEDIIAFKKKHKKTFAKDGRYFAEEKREYKKPEILVRKLITDRYVKERTKKMRLLE